jgi:hypothetical protein
VVQKSYKKRHNISSQNCDGCYKIAFFGHDDQMWYLGNVGTSVVLKTILKYQIEMSQAILENMIFAINFRGNEPLIIIIIHIILNALKWNKIL